MASEDDAASSLRALVPKNDSQGVMIKGFQSIEFGYGLDLTNEQLKQVSKFHEGKKYINKAAATKYRGTGINNETFDSNPFFFEFKYSAANEVYWNYKHMILQLDDCIDILKCLYLEYDFLFLFDHLCGQ